MKACHYPFFLSGLAVILAVSASWPVSAAGGYIDVTLFRRHKPAQLDNYKKLVDLGEDITEGDGKQAHPDPTIARKWISGRGGGPVAVTGGQDMHLFLRNVNSGECVTFTLSDANNNVILRTQVGNLDNGLFSYTYQAHSTACPESGILKDVSDNSLMCKGQTTGTDWAHQKGGAYICLKLPANSYASAITWKLGESLVLVGAGESQGGDSNDLVISGP